jgi:outer membrane lipoprotein SlyB
MVVMAISALLLNGCAAPMSVQKNFLEDAGLHISRSDWEKAYRTLEDALGSTESGTRLAAYDLISAYPEIQAAAARTFSKESLLITFNSYDQLTAYEIESVRLSWYVKFASESEVFTAQSTLEAVKAEENQRASKLAYARRLGLDSLVVDEGIFGQLVEEDQKKFRKQYPTMQVIPYDSVGIVRSHQIIDKSTTGSLAGSQLGSAVAQAAYIDRSFKRYNYSALGQLGAGLLGGVLGASMNTAPESRYLINYSVEFRDGSIRGVIKSSRDGIAAPSGQCVFTNDIQEAPRYLCADTITAFIDRARRVGSAADNNGSGKLKEKVSCKIEVVGTITLDKDACQKTGGVVVE